MAFLPPSNLEPEAVSKGIFRTFVLQYSYSSRSPLLSSALSDPITYHSLISALNHINILKAYGLYLDIQYTIRKI